MLENRLIEEIETMERDWNIYSNLFCYEGCVFSQSGDDGFSMKHWKLD